MKRRIIIKYKLELFPKKHDELTFYLEIKYRKLGNFESYNIKPQKKGTILIDPSPWISTIDFELLISLDANNGYTRSNIRTKSIEFEQNDIFGDVKTKAFPKMKLYVISKKEKYLVSIITINSIEIICDKVINIYHNCYSLDRLSKTSLLPIVVSYAAHVSKVSETIMWLNSKYPDYRIKIRHICVNQNKYVIFYDIERIKWGHLINVSDESTK